MGDYLPLIVRVLGMVVPFVIGAIFMRVIARLKPKKDASGLAVIVPNRLYMLFIGLVGGGLYYFVLYVIPVENMYFVVIGGSIGIILAFAALCPLMTDLNVRWNNRYVEGPAKVWFGFQLPQRTDFLWTEICDTGITRSTYWYVETYDGERVYFSRFYSGHTYFTRALQENCPDVEIAWDA